MKLIDAYRKRQILPSRLMFSSILRQKLFCSLILPAAVGMLCVWSIQRADAQLTILHSFGDGTVPNDGAYPSAALIVGPGGDLFGVTDASAQDLEDPSGTVFRVTSSGVLTIIKTFNFQQTHPLLNYNGTLVGVSPGGPAKRGRGALFQLKQTTNPQQWRLKYLFQFGANNVLVPSGGVIVGSDGAFYGTTRGTSTTTGAGTVYKFDPKTSTLTVLHSFTVKGAMSPEGTLLQGSDGNFYGSATEFAFNFTASIFMMTPTGRVTIIQKVPGKLSYVGQPLIQATDGNYYGSFGSSADNGFIFKMTPAHTITAIHTFQGSDGKHPNGLVQGPNGNLYGTTDGGGTAGNGVVFEVSTDGSSFTILHSFGDGTIQHDGALPTGSLVVGPDNNLYGVTDQGGSAGLGTVFKISP